MNPSPHPRAPAPNPPRPLTRAAAVLLLLAATGTLPGTSLVSPAFGAEPASPAAPAQAPPAAGPNSPRTNPGPRLETLTRGLIAVGSTNGHTLVSWRLLAGDPADLGFNIYRSDSNAPPRRLNASVWREATSFLDTNPPARLPVAYSIRTVANGQEGTPITSPFARLDGTHPAPAFLEIPLQLPPETTANDASAADLDGDGDYDLVLKSEQRPRDSSAPGLTGRTVLQGYTLQGRLLWTIHLGPNIREGAHYTPFVAIDLDGDGRAEVACKTADGTRDGLGRIIGDAKADWRDTQPRSPIFGKVLRGPEYFTVFDGRTGAALATTNYLPSRGDLAGWGGIGGNGGNDRTGNRADRFLACAALLDGHLPSVVMCRGYYGRSVLAAWDWRNHQLALRWIFDSAAPGHGKDGQPHHAYSGMGAHSVSAADVDGDGLQEIIYHSMVVDDDGQGLFTTGLRHGDALHVGDFDPDRAGLEVFGVHESEEATARLGTPGTAAFDARTGAILWSDGPGRDVGRGLAADIDPNHAGAEMWSVAAGLRTAQGRRIGTAPRSQNFAVWWDGDLLRELLDRTTIAKWRPERQNLQTLLSATDCAANNGSKANPCLSADLLGDWREEVVWRTRDSRALRVYSSPWPTRHRFTTLMHDPQYRMSIAWQNSGYNQPPHPGFYLGTPPPTPSTSSTAPTSPDTPRAR